MFTLRFFGGFRRQKKEFLEASEYAPCKLHPSVQKQLDYFSDSILGEISPSDTQKSVWRSSVQAVRALLFQSALSNTGSALCVLGSVYASKAVLDHTDSILLAVSLAGLFLLSESIDNILNFFELRRRGQVARGIQLHLLSRVNRKLLDLDPTCDGELSRGNLKTLVASDIESVEDFITAAAANWIPTTILFVVLTPTIYAISGTLGLLALLVALLQIPISVFFARLIEKYQDKQQTQLDRLTTLVGEWVQNIRLVRYLGWQGAIARDLKDLVRRLTIDSSLRHTLTIVTYGISFSWWMAPVLTMLVAAYAYSIPLELSGFFSSIWALSYVGTYLSHIPHSISMYGAAAAGVKRINTLLAAPELKRFITPSKGPRPQGAPLAVRCCNLTVAIEGREIINLPEFSFDLGKKTAIVGSVGSGKSVLLELLIGERAPTTGTIEVCFGSNDWRSLWDADSYATYRSHVAFSPQQPFLSNATLRRNIDLGDDLSAMAIEEATQEAQLVSDLALFPSGYEEEVGEIGINLSGGQKQRVSLARAFASQRSILVLDDPLSAVDRSTEQKLVQRILRAQQGLLLVSHRLDELAVCDRVIVLDKGRVIEEGTPEALISKKNSAFQRFLKASRHKSAEEAA